MYMNVALIMAGGSGRRMLVDEKKQFLLINGKPLIAYTLAKFCGHPEIDVVVIVAPEVDIERMQAICRQYFPEEEIMISAGGAERQISVINGLKACPDATDIVLIHDAVRPFVTGEMISDLISLAKIHQAVIPCSPVRNTIKRISGHQITETVAREDLYNAHTPQVFDYSLIYKYHQKALPISHQFTDDSSILEYFQQPVYFYLCDDSNFKITQPYDLVLAEYLLK
jgi:2-C-methyl-D-erythritol 4-phosphate cytidylyltransferase